MFVLNLSSDYRILSVCVELPATPPEMPRVRSYPDNPTDYKFVNNEFVYDPLPAPPELEPEPSQLDRIEAQIMWTALMTDTLLEEDIFND